MVSSEFLQGCKLRVDLDRSAENGFCLCLILYNYGLEVNIRFYGPDRLYSPRPQAVVNIARSGP